MFMNMMHPICNCFHPTAERWITSYQTYKEELNCIQKKTALTKMAVFKQTLLKSKAIFK